ncbi:MAG: hypothetical protein E7372_05270 [Clostridiales bacterium]|nr:hypothetical protein [Clostridiales bacterium]
MQKYFEILGLPVTATDEEIENAYKTLKEKYSRERFLEGEKGNEAAKQLTKIETAYNEIMENRKANSSDLNSFVAVEELIKAGNISLAQAKLDDISDRNAEWHYLQSVIFYKKNWLNESKKQLEIAMNIEPHNNKYAEAYTRLKDKMEYNNRQYNNGYYGNQSHQQTSQQMGGTDSNGCVNDCLTLCCMNMMCNMCLNCR